jgi:putative addiction module killer protein
VHTIEVKITVKQRVAEIYESPSGKKPYFKWIKGLKDNKGKAKIFARVDRAKTGNFGDYKDLKDGVFEMREDFGPGYRIYFGIDGDEIIILLAGGDKGSQDSDIAKAKDYWLEYLVRKQK